MGAAVSDTLGVLQDATANVAEIGDVDGDGVADIDAGAPSDRQPFSVPCPPDQACDPTGFPLGRAFLFGGTTLALLREPVPVTAGHVAFGRSVTPAGDLSGDGVPDVIVGASGLTPGPGTLFAFSGADGARLWSAAEQPAAPEASVQGIVAGVGNVVDVPATELAAPAPTALA